jgi:hypothetical protein
MPRKAHVWAEEEEALLLRSYEQHGSKWTLLQQILADSGYTRPTETIRLKCIKSAARTEEELQRIQHDKYISKLAVSKPWLQN